MKRFLTPDHYFDDLDKIENYFFDNNKIKVIFCDIDNTLVRYSEREATEYASRFIERVLAGTKPEDNVFIGNDLVSDIEMANKAGIFSIGFNLTQVPGINVKPDVEIATFATLMKIL